jgi:hypothetical protein
MNRPQEVPEGPLGHLSVLPPSFRVSEAEVDALKDTGDDHISGRIREAVIRARLMDGQRVGGGPWGI